MSASLVGSEMCIRDRPRTLHATHGTTLQRGTRDMHQSTQRTAQHVHHEAVSYTHLTLPTICSV
eukprot:3761696-Alexandrium_andersonii.AAC.1